MTAFMAQPDEPVPSGLTGLVPIVTNLLLYRLYKIIWKRSVKEQLGGWAKQRALARVVAAISGARVPSKADAEFPGQLMYNHLTTSSGYVKKHTRLCASESEAARRARAKGATPPEPVERLRLECELYYCKYGCTPRRLPVRATPVGAQRRDLPFETCDAAAINIALRTEIAELRQAGTKEVKEVKAELEETQRDLSATIDAAHAARAERDQEHVARQLEARRAAAAEGTVKEQDSTIKQQAGKVLRLESQLGKAHGEAGRQKRKAEQAEQSQQILRRKLAEAQDRLIARTGKPTTLQPHRTTKARHRKRGEELQKLKRSLEA